MKAVLLASQPFSVRARCGNDSIGIRTTRAPAAPAAARHRNHRHAATGKSQTGGDAAAAQQQQQQQPPPYAQLSMPVYSLATVDPSGGSPTMNLVTYAAPISLDPRHYALGLYVGTLSWQNMLATHSGVLQVLGEHHAALFDLLGRTSGRDVDKLQELAARGVAVTRRARDGVPLLDDNLGWMQLRFAADPVRCGDHDVAICEVVEFGGGNGTAAPHAPQAASAQAARPLYTGHLRQLGLM